MRPKIESVDQRVARIAGCQHGNVALRQLLAAGLSRQAVKRRVKKGLLHREFRGVYRVGHRAPSVEARYMAAVLACGEGAVLAGRAAAYLYGLIKGSASAPEVISLAPRRVRGVTTHSARHLDPREVTIWCGIPVTTVARTVVDLAGELTPRPLGRACHEAQVRHRMTAAMVYAVLDRRPRAPGARKLHHIFRGDFLITLSELERLVLELLRSATLPLPQTNRHVDYGYVDCRWPERRLTIELDSYRYHHTRHAWEEDRRRERSARLRGDEFRRFSHRPGRRRSGATSIAILRHASSASTCR